jgi:hypothetical protein
MYFQNTLKSFRTIANLFRNASATHAKTMAFAFPESL